MLLPWNGHERHNSTPALSRENVVGLSRTAGSPAEVKGLQWWEAPGPLRLPQSANGVLILKGRTKDTQSVRAISWLQTQGHKPGLSLCHSNHIRVVSAPGSWFTSLYVKISQFPRSDWPKQLMPVCSQPIAQLCFSLCDVSLPSKSQWWAQGTGWT